MFKLGCDKQFNTVLYHGCHLYSMCTPSLCQICLCQQNCPFLNPMYSCSFDLSSSQSCWKVFSFGGLLSFPRCLKFCHLHFSTGKMNIGRTKQKKENLFYSTSNNQILSSYCSFSLTGFLAWLLKRHYIKCKLKSQSLSS